MASDNTGSQSGKAGRWLLGLLLVGFLGAGAAASFIPSRLSSELGLAMTHSIVRGDLLVTVTEQGTLESSNNIEIKCKVRGDNTIIWVIESGTEVKPGDELVRLDTLFIEEQISERTKFSHLAKSGVARSQADVARAGLAIEEYLQGQFVSELATLNKDLTIAKSKHLTAKNMLSHSKMMAESDYASELDVEEREFMVSQAALEVKLNQTRIGVLQRFTKEERLVRLNGDLKAAKAKLEADKERAYADEQRLKRAQEELGYCVVKAESTGIVIYPTGKAWEDAPDIEEGATVNKDQVMLLMPNLSKMQVKVGIHESVIERIQPGLEAKVTLPKTALNGKVSSVAAVAQPAGWWTGNVVKYDTIVELPSIEGLKPGMSVEVEVIMKRHANVLMVPAAAVVETSQGHACWIETAKGWERRALKLGDSSDMFLVVEAGLTNGDEVVLNPLAYIPEAQEEAAKTIDEAKKGEDLVAS
ncbi:MAG TPA: hypothetical protein QF564_34310 [Pirellulaceae bacterium]|nr:hypothetical protein [Pirellulaceae bacterium]